MGESTEQWNQLHIGEMPHAPSFTSVEPALGTVAPSEDEEWDNATGRSMSNRTQTENGRMQRLTWRHYVFWVLTFLLCGWCCFVAKDPHQEFQAFRQLRPRLQKEAELAEVVADEAGADGAPVL